MTDIKARLQAAHAKDLRAALEEHRNSDPIYCDALAELERLERELADFKGILRSEIAEREQMESTLDELVSREEHRNSDPIYSDAPLSRRELFAAIAMQSLIAKTPLEYSDVSMTEHVRRVTSGAVDYADALLKELAK